MIQAKIYQNKKKQICGYCISGHAGFAEEGEDIVCAAVSILTINTTNAIEQLTDSAFQCEAAQEQGGYLKVVFPKLQKGQKDHDATLLLQAMVLGLEALTEEYAAYIRLQYEEV